MAELIYKDEVYAIIGSAMDVYNTLGPGFSESVYQEAFGIEMLKQSISVKGQHGIAIMYKGKPLRKTFVADYLAYEKFIIQTGTIRED